MKLYKRLGVVSIFVVFFLIAQSFMYGAHAQSNAFVFPSPANLRAESSYINVSYQGSHEGFCPSFNAPHLRIRLTHIIPHRYKRIKTL